MRHTLWTGCRPSIHTHTTPTHAPCAMQSQHTTCALAASSRPATPPPAARSPTSSRRPRTSCCVSRGALSTWSPSMAWRRRHCAASRSHSAAAKSGSRRGARTLTNRALACARCGRDLRVRVGALQALAGVGWLLKLCGQHAPAVRRVGRRVRVLRADDGVHGGVARALTEAESVR